jgi:preprotein translocase subunit SecG
MFTLMVIFHILASLVLILVVLLQSGKAGDLASAFGGSGTQTAFGARGAATVLTKATTICAVIFMLTSLGLSITFIRNTQGGSVMEGVRQPAQTSPAPTPANPAESSGGSPVQGQSPALDEPAPANQGQQPEQ